MEIVILEKDIYTLEVVQDSRFPFPDETTAAGYSRDVNIPEFKITLELFNKLISAGFKIELGQPIPGFKVTVGFPNRTLGPHEGSIQLFGVDQFLLSLSGGQARWMEEAKVRLEVTEIVCRGQERPRHTIIIPTRQCPLFNCGQPEAKRFAITSTTGENWINRWSSRFSQWTIFGAVKLILPRFIGADSDVPDLLATTRKMLTDDDLADTMVIAKNGTQIKFHRSILAAHSPVFERMFLTKMQEAASGVLELPDMTEESVRALKEYLYVWELKAPEENPLVCFELFEAGHKYGISTLEGATSKILLRMDGVWYSAGIALRLYLMVKDMELPDLMQKAVEMLKLKRADLKTVEEYRDLFRKEKAAVAMELMECLAAP